MDVNKDTTITTAQSEYDIRATRHDRRRNRELGPRASTRFGERLRPVEFLNRVGTHGKRQTQIVQCLQFRYCYLLFFLTIF